MKAKAVLFGLNYSHMPNAALNGCVNDVQRMAQQIKTVFDGQLPVEVFTDDIDMNNTSYDGIIHNLYNLAIQSYSKDLDFVWIHFSGHGSQKKDTSGDELDYLDEGICPSDFNDKGVIADDVLNNIMSTFNSKTKVLFVADCCHSGSILDLKYTWDVDGKKYKTDNKKCKIMSNVILISGCMDNQTSADAYNLLDDRKHIGALTASFIKVLEKRPQQLYDVFLFVSSVRTELKKAGFNQYPCLSSTTDISKDPSMVIQQTIEQIKVKQQDWSNPPPKLYNKPSAFSQYYRPLPQRTVQQTPVQYYGQQQQYYEAQSTLAPRLLYVTYVPVYEGYF